MLVSKAPIVELSGVVPINLQIKYIFLFILLGLFLGFLVGFCVCVCVCVCVCCCFWVVWVVVVFFVCVCVLFSFVLDFGFVCCLLIYTLLQWQLSHQIRPNSPWLPQPLLRFCRILTGHGQHTESYCCLPGNGIFSGIRRIHVLWNNITTYILCVTTIPPSSD